MKTTAGIDAAIVSQTLELFDTERTAPGAWPNPEALEGRLLARLLRGDRVTSGEWWRVVHASRLAASVHKLRRTGWSVRTDTREVATLDGGRRAHIAVYSLGRDQLAAAVASQDGRQFIGAVDAAEGRQP